MATEPIASFGGLSLVKKDGSHSQRFPLVERRYLFGRYDCPASWWTVVVVFVRAVSISPAGGSCLGTAHGVPGLFQGRTKHSYPVRYKRGRGTEIRMFQRVV